MCNEKTCEVCHGDGTVETDAGWNCFPWVNGGKLIEVNPCPKCGAMDADEERKIKREFERPPDSLVSGG